MSWFTGFAQQGAQQAAGGIFGLALGSASNKQQFKQQKKLTRLQIDAQKQMTDYNYGKQMQMWNDTNYKAQMEQLEMAGLNPGLIYGMSGGGGASTNIAQGNIAAGQAANHAGAAANTAATMAQLGLMRAQKENIEADTANKQADIPVKAATIPKIEAETKDLLQGIKNKEAQEKLTDVQTALLSIDEYIKGKTQNMAVAMYGYQLELAREGLETAERENDINQSTKNARIMEVKAHAVGEILRNELTRAQTGATKTGTRLTEEQIKKVVEEVKIMISTDRRAWTETGYHATDSLKKILGDNDNSIEAMITGIVSGLISRATGGQQAPAPIRGLHNRK